MPAMPARALVPTLIPQLQIIRGLAAASSKADQLAAVKALRERSGAPISDVKGALQECSWDPDQAFTALRKRGLAAATKKASRHAAEGLVGVAARDRDAVLVEVNSETDFAARDHQFMHVVRRVAEAAMRSSVGQGPGTSSMPVDVISAEQLSEGGRVAEAISDVGGVIRENIRLRRAVRVRADRGVVGCYLHSSPSPALGKAAAAVALEPVDSTDAVEGSHVQKAQDLAHKVAMHAVAMKPDFMDAAAVSPQALEAEKQVLRDQAAKSGKPANIIEKMVQGRMKKFYEETCLLEQKYVQDDSQTVKAFVDKMSQQLGLHMRVAAFARLQCGEGLEKEGKDFAQEVSDTLKAVQ